MCVPFLCTISFSSWSYHEPYLLKCFSTHFGCALCIKIIHVVRKILLDVGKKSCRMSQPFVGPFHLPLQPLFLSPFPFLSPVHTVTLSHEPPSSVPSETFPTTWHPGPLLPFLQAQVYFFFAIKSYRMSGWLPWLPLPRWVLCFCGAGALISV